MTSKPPQATGLSLKSVFYDQSTFQPVDLFHKALPAERLGHNQTRFVSPQQDNTYIEYRNSQDISRGPADNGSGNNMLKVRHLLKSAKVLPYASPPTVSWMDQVKEQGSGDPRKDLRYQKASFELQ